METITKAIWGDNTAKEEPVSGAQGDVSKGEPYDAGNIEEQSVKTTEPSTTEATESVTKPEATTATTTSAPEVGTTTNPAETKDSSVKPGDSTAAQNDTRDPENPKTNPGTKEHKARENVDNSTAGPDQDENPVKVDGPGPRPVADVAKEHGGDAGKASSDEQVNKSSNDKPGAGTAGAAGGEDSDGPQTTSSGEGTGEKYIKSSGLKADGGDFDAANAGAGREADRLLEEKGVHLTGQSPQPPAETPGKAADSTPTKVSLKDKIKAKLHKS